VDTDRALGFAEGLLSLPTAPFAEHLPIDHVVDFADERPGLTRSQDAAGNVVVRYDGPGADPSRPLVLVAHLDHPGFAVDEVTGDQLSLTFHGGLGADHARPGSPLHLFRPGGVDPVGEARLVAAEGRNGRLTGATAEVVAGEADASGFAMWGFPGYGVVDGRITGRVCDDLLGAAAVLATLDALAREAPDGVSVWGLFTRAEEVGFLGALAAIRLGTVPTGASVLSLECSKALPDAPQGGGVIVRVGDRMSIFDPGLTEALRRAAEGATTAEGGAVRSQRKLMDGGACEATAFCVAGYRASGLALPLGNYHNAADEGPGAGVAPEHVRVDDYLAEVALLTRLALDPALLVEGTTGPPSWFTERTAVAMEQLVGDGADGDGDGDGDGGR
jgi:putative aminopeptidase FrvX